MKIYSFTHFYARRECSDILVWYVTQSALDDDYYSRVRVICFSAEKYQNYKIVYDTYLMFVFFALPFVILFNARNLKVNVSYVTFI